MTDRRTCSGLLIAVATLLVSAPGAADPARLQSDWGTPFRAQLPDPARQLRLPAGTDPADWAASRGLDGYRTLYRGPDGAILETTMGDADWQAFEDRACGDAGVACETAACRSIQFRGDVAPGEGTTADAVKARLVRNEPERAPVDDDPNASPGLCSAPLAGLGDGAGAGPGADITLEIDVSGGDRTGRGLAPATEDTLTADTPSSGTGSAAPGATRRSFEFALQRGFNAVGGARLDADAVPTDTSDWTLMVDAGCSEVAIPLDALEPAQVPGLVTALVQAGTPAAVAAAFNLSVVREIDLDSTAETLTVFAGAANVAASAAALLLDPRVSAAQPEYVYRTAAEPGDITAAPDVPAYSDPFAPLSYGPQLTGVLGLHPRALGGGQLVAMIDTGLDADHADLVDRIRETVDVTDRGWSGDLHGTAVAGIIAANANNAEGSYGVAPSAEILAIKACQPLEAGSLRAKCWTSTLVKALDLAISRDARVINMSLAGPPDDLVARYVSLATADDRLVVAAAGNNGPQGRPAYPAALPEVLAVTAVDAREHGYVQANLGAYIDLAAPGVDIISPAPDGSYPPLSGTSMAAAHVAGAATLLRELAPDAGGRALREALRDRARDLGDAGSDPQFGAGLLDACAAAGQATAQAVSCSAPGGSHAP